MAKAKTKTYCLNCRHDDPHRGDCKACVILVGIACEGFENGEVEIIKEAKPPMPLVIHIVPVANLPPNRAVTGPALCGEMKGRVGHPDISTLVIDRWCSRCWNAHAKRKVREAA